MEVNAEILQIKEEEGRGRKDLCSLWTWLETREINTFISLFGLTVKCSECLLCYMRQVWASNWGKIKQESEVISLNWVLKPLCECCMNFNLSCFLVPWFWIETKLYLSSRLFLVCFFFVCFRILKVLTQVKNTSATLLGVMSLLGSLWAKGRYVHSKLSRCAHGIAESFRSCAKTKIW